MAESEFTTGEKALLQNTNTMCWEEALSVSCRMLDDRISEDLVKHYVVKKHYSLTDIFSRPTVSKIISNYFSYGFSIDSNNENSNQIHGKGNTVIKPNRLHFWNYFKYILELHHYCLLFVKWRSYKKYKCLVTYDIWVILLLLLHNT